MIEDKPYVWLYAIDVPTEPRKKLRVTPYTSPLAFEKNSQNDDIIYSPADVSHSIVEVGTDADLNNIELLIENVSQYSASLLENYEGLIGERVRIVLIHLPDLVTQTTIYDDAYEVLDSDADESSVRLQLGQFSLQNVDFPNRRITRNYCGHAYGDGRCGYDTTRTGALQSCSKLKLGANGCEEHGDDEVAAGLTRRHPRRFLGFEGVLRTSGIGVSR